MGLTLDALKAIEARKSQRRPFAPAWSPSDAPSQSAALMEPVAEPLDEPTSELLPEPMAETPREAAVPPAPVAEPRGIEPWFQSIEIAAESTLQQVETFVALATETYSLAPVEPRSDAEPIEPAEEAQCALPELDRWDERPADLEPIIQERRTEPERTAVVKETPALQATSEPATQQSSASDHDTYQELAVSVLEQLATGRPAALAFTSSGDGHGKTAVLARLAPVLAQRAGGDVLLVDANFHNADLGEALGMDPTRRLPDVLGGKASWTEAVRRTSVARLSLLAGGHLGERALATGTIDLGGLLREMKRRYQLVLIDTASLAHDEVAPILGSCEGTYLVERVGVSHPRAVRDAVGVIERSHGRLLGCIAVGS